MSKNFATEPSSQPQFVGADKSPPKPDSEVKSFKKRMDALEKFRASNVGDVYTQTDLMSKGSLLDLNSREEVTDWKSRVDAFTNENSSG